VRITYDARTIANYFLELAHGDRIPLDPLKLQKLVYLAQGWHLAFYGTPLISQAVEAWRYGPVVPQLYYEFRQFGAWPITRRAETSETLDDRTKNFLQKVWQIYRAYNSLQLSALTHEAGGAWDLAMRTRESWTPWGRPVIPNELIAQEFLRRKAQG
jgi:uncharacterized phage-associated protein